MMRTALSCPTHVFFLRPNVLKKEMFGQLKENNGRIKLTTLNANNGRNSQ